MSIIAGNPDIGAVVFVELGAPETLPKTVRQYWKSNPQSVVYCGENAHGIWVGIPDATLKGQDPSSNKTSDLGPFSLLIPWVHVRTIIQLKKTPAKLRRKIQCQ